MWITANCGKFLKKWEYHLTCRLGNIYVNQELPDVQAGLEKGEEPEIKLPTFIGS